MALQPGARVKLDIFAQLAALSGYKGGPYCDTPSVDQAFGSGSGSNQAENLHCSARNLAASTSETINLETIPNGNGVGLGAAEVVVFIIQAAVANTSNIRVDDSPATPWLALLSSSGATDDAQLDIAPGCTVALIAPPDGSYPVNAGSRSFDVTNLDGANAADYTLFVLTRDS